MSKLDKKTENHIKAVARVAGKQVLAEEIATAFQYFEEAGGRPNAPDLMLNRLMDQYPGDPHHALAIRMRVQAAFALGPFLKFLCAGCSPEAINAAIAETPLKINGIDPSFHHDDFRQTIETVKGRFGEHQAEI